MYLLNSSNKRKKNKTMHSITGFIIRTSAFVSKELVEILRQTRLLLALVLGPFLILLLFGIGYRNEARPLRTLFVVPAGQEGIAQQVQQYGTSLGPQIDYRGIAQSEENALAQLARDQVDAVVTIPSDVEQAIRSNQQPVIRLYHHEIDPSQVSYVQYVAQIYVDELNRRVLQKTAEQSQKEAGTVQKDLQVAKDSAHAMRMAFESGNGNEAQNQRGKMTRSLDAVSLGVGASLGVLQGVEQTMGPNQGAGEGGAANEILSTFQSINTNNESLQDTPTDKSSYPGEAQRAAKIEQDIDRLNTQLSDFRQIDPLVLVSPFHAEAVNVNNIKLNASDFFAPGVVVLLLQHLLTTFAALSLVRERTAGTMELFRVAPITPFETLLGKYLSYMIIAALLATAITALVVLALHVPMLGDWRNYALVLLALMFASLGIGFIISLLSETTSQSVQYSMLVLLFSIFFSGFFLDLRLLWDKIRFLAYLVPTTYAMQMLQEIMFRASPIPNLLMAGLLGFGLVLFVISWILLSRQMRLR
jgi:ABC-2 type transport system permease protein